MSAGDLNTPLTIQSRDTGTDAAGQPVTTWADVATVWGDIRGDTGMAAIRNSTPHQGVATSINSYSIKIYYRTDFTVGMRAVDGITGEIYDIKQIKHDKARREWSYLVSEVGGNEG